MKKVNVLQLTFVLIGVVFGILSLPSLFTLLIGTFVSAFNSGGFDRSDFIIYNVFVVLGIGLQIFVCWILIFRSAKFAIFIQKKSGLGTGFKIISNPNDLLNILLIVIGIYLLLTNLSPLLKAILESFKNKTTSGIQHLYDDARPIDWSTIILDIILPLVLLMFAKPIADYFTKNINEDQISIEETEKINKTDLLNPTED